jgi:hypothetical protein
MARVRAVLLAILGSAVIAACGGSSSSNSGSGSTPPPPTTSASPCSTADTADVAAVGSFLQSGLAPPDKKSLIDGDPRGRVYEALALNRIATARRRGAAGEAGQKTSAVSPAPVADDIGEISVLQDTGDLVLPQNVYDLKGTGLRFSRNGSGYTISKIDATFRTALGSRVTLGDDDNVQMAVPFSFPFYGTGQTAAFVNSDGNITFGEGDSSSTDRNLARLLTGPPRVAPFFADLDPTQGISKIFVNAAADQFTVTWCNVRGFDSTRVATVQATMLPDGSVEIKEDATTNLGDAIIGLSPGHTGTFTAVNLSDGTGSSSDAIGERFAASASLDTVAVAKKFYGTHPDNYDQILLWTDQTLLTDAFAYEVTVANEIRGIGQDIYDLSTSFGSAGRLRSLVVMDSLTKYPDDPQAKFLGENNTLSVMGQEVGHRWLAYMQFRDHTGATSNALLGRDLAHWSFFFNSDASVMEGNQIQDLGGGQFRTVDAVKRYSALDQYAMGLVGAPDVPPFFYVEAPSGATQSPASAPQIGVSFTGTRRDVLVNDVVAVEGPRVPAVANSPRTHRQAFIYVVSSGRNLDTGQVAKLDKIRQQWTTFFLQATGGHMTAITTLH